MGYLRTAGGGNSAIQLASVDSSVTEIDIGSFSASSNANILFYANNAEKMRLDYNGNLGIGTNSWSGRLYVSGSSTTSDPTAVIREGVVSPVGGAGVLDVQNSAGTSLLFVSGSGAVGIGTSVPSSGYKLDVRGYAQINTANPNLAWIGTYRQFYAQVVDGANSAASYWRLYDQTSTSGRLHIYASGDVTPGADNSQNLGTSSLRWANVYATSVSGSLTGSNVSAGQVVVAGTGGVISGSNDFWWDNTNRYVGIGTSTLSARFHVLAPTGAQIARFAHATSSGHVGFLYNTSTFAGYIGNGNDVLTGASSTEFVMRSEGGLVFASNGNIRRVTINSSGNVGIGTSSFTGRLYVTGSSTASTPTMVVREGVVSPTAGVGVLDVQNSAGTTLLFVTGSGYVGINTNNPAYALDVVGTGRVSSTFRQLGGDAYFNQSATGNSYFHTTAYFGKSGGVGVGGTDYERLSVTYGSIANEATGTGTYPNFQLSNGGNVRFNVPSSLSNALGVTGSLEPDAAGTRDLGSSTKNWKNFYATNISGSYITGSNLISGQITVAGTGGLLSGSNKLYWDNTNVRVGIGTNSPSDTLDVRGQIYMGGSANQYLYTDGSNNLNLQVNAGQIIFLRSAGSNESMRIDTSGNVGIGTASTSYALHVYRTSSPAIKVEDAGDSSYFEYTTEGLKLHAGGRPINFVAGNSQKANIEAGGTMGLTGSFLPGTDNTYSLGSSTKRWSNVYATSVSGSLTGSNVTAGQVVVAGTGGVLSGSNNFWWDNTNGRVGIGTSSLGSKLQVSGSGSDVVNAGGFTAGDSYVYLGTGTTYGVIGAYRGDRGTSRNLVIQSAGGNVGISGTNPVSRLEVTGSGASSATSTFHLLNSSNTSMMFVRDDGLVGIGTSSPASLLTVSGTIVTKYNTGLESYIAAGTYSAGTTGLYPVYNTQSVTGGTFGSNDTVVKYGAGGNSYVLLHGTTVVMSANSSENVSIGTNSYAGRLYVSGSSTATTPTMVVREGVSSPLGGAGAFDVQNSAGTSLLFVTGSGYVGVGTTVPGVAAGATGLDIYGTDAQIRFHNSVSGGGSTHGILVSIANDKSGYFWNYEAASLVLGTNNLERARIDSSGNVGIGTATFSDKLAVNGSMSVTGSLLPGTDNLYSLGSSSKRWSNMYATTTTSTTVTAPTHVTTASSTGSTYSKTFASGESGRITATVDVTVAGSKSFTVAVNNGAMLYDVSLVSSEGGFSVAKKYTVSMQYNTSPITFKLMDTGPYTGYDMTVSFSKSSATTSQCTISHNYTSTVNVALTIDVAATSTGNSGTTVTLF